MQEQPKYPEIEYAMPSEYEERGNAFVILGEVKKLLMVNGVSKAEQAQFIAEATSGDYENLRDTVRRWVTVI